jgi:hypothetical protein
MKTRALGLVASAALTVGAGVALASPASAHDVPRLEDPSPLNVAGNAGNGLDYFLNHLQHGHVEEPLLGFGPAVEDPVGWTGEHFLPIAIETVERVGGIAPTDGGGHDGGDGGHDH